MLRWGKGGEGVSCGGKWGKEKSKPHGSLLSEGSSIKPKASQQDVYKIDTAGNCSLHAPNARSIPCKAAQKCLDINTSVTCECQFTMNVPVLRRRPARTLPQRVLKAHQVCAGAGPVSERNPAVLLKHSWQQPIQTLPRKDLRSSTMDNSSLLES